MTELGGGFARFQSGSWPGAYAGYDLLRWMTLEEDGIAVEALEHLTTDLDALVGPGGWVDRTERPAEASAWLPEPVLPEVVPSPLPAVSGLDPCALLSPETVGAARAVRLSSPLRFSYASPACAYVSGQGRVAMLAVRGQTATLEEAEGIVDGLFGGDRTRGLAQGRFNPCWLDRRDECPYAVAGWLDGHLAVVVFPPASIGRRPVVSVEDGAVVMQEILAGIGR